jgi:hypothetical protein
MTAVGPGVNITEILVFLKAFTTMLTLCYMITYRKAETYGMNKLIKMGLLLLVLLLWVYLFL